MSDVFIDGVDQLGHAREHTAAQPLFSQVAEETLDHVQPRRRGGREVHVDARMLCQPPLHVRMLVGGVVVDDQVQCLVRGRFAIDLFEELQPLGVAVTLLALGDELAVEHID